MKEHNPTIAKRIRRRVTARKALHKRNQQRKYTSFKLERDWIDYESNIIEGENHETN